MAATPAKATPPHLRMKANITNVVASSPLSFPIAVPDDSEDSTPKFTPMTDSTNFLSSSPSPTPATEMDADFGTPAPARDHKFDEVDDDDFPSSPSLEASVHAPAAKMKQPSAPASRASSRPGLRGVPGTRLGATVVKHYESEDLIGIGKQCSNRLPPASAIQAMFLYEMQRETEAERLFHSQMFRLAKSEDEVAAQARRFDEMESRMRKLEVQLGVQGAKDEKRITANEGKLNEQQQELFRATARLTEAEQKLIAVVNQLNTVKELHEGAAAEAADAVKQAAQDAVSAATANASSSANGDFDVAGFNTMKLEIDVLFKDRDGIISKLTEVNSAVQSLVQSVHQLNIQGGTKSAGLSPAISATVAQPQRLAVTSANGELVDLSIPKVKPVVPEKPRNMQEVFQEKKWKPILPKQ